MSELFPELNKAVATGNRNEAKRITQLLIDQNVAPDKIVDQGLVPGMTHIGEKFKRNEAFVPEMLIAARAMKESMTILEPLLTKAGIKPKYTAVIGTVQGDLHDIGKNLVAMMWKGANIGVIDLGTNVPPEKFVVGWFGRMTSVNSGSGTPTSCPTCVIGTQRAHSRHERRAGH